MLKHLSLDSSRFPHRGLDPRDLIPSDILSSALNMQYLKAMVAQIKNHITNCSHTKTVHFSIARLYKKVYRNFCI